MRLFLAPRELVADRFASQSERTFRLVDSLKSPRVVIPASCSAFSQESPSRTTPPSLFATILEPRFPTTWCGFLPPSLSDINPDFEETAYSPWEGCPSPLGLNFASQANLAPQTASCSTEPKAALSSTSSSQLIARLVILSLRTAGSTGTPPLPTPAPRLSLYILSGSPRVRFQWRFRTRIMEGEIEGC